MRSPDDVITDYHFPKAGVDQSQAFVRQPVRPDKRGSYVRTTFDALNVRGYDPATGRDRGGSRPGYAKWIATRVNGVFITQHLNILVTTSQSGATLQLSQSGRVVSVIAVSQGVVKVANPDSVAWASTTNNSGTTPPLNFSGVMASAQNNQKLYIVDGTNYRYYAPTTNSVEAWTATSGSLPVDGSGNKARLICTWRGRTVLSGLLLDPQNWFMSAVSNPHNFNNSPSPYAPTAAVAGNNAGLGLIGDVVTGLCPYTDDVLVFFGDHTTYMMRGDPTAGGQIDLVSDAIGAAWGEAFCRDPYGNVYFFSNRCGIYTFVPGRTVPNRMSQAIDPLLAAVDTGTNIIRLFWDDSEQGMHVFITEAADVGETTHYFWDQRNNAWFPDEFANTDHNPVAGVVLDGNNPGDRKLLIGSWDGYVRTPSAAAATDDGSAMPSEIWIGPIMTPNLDTMLLKEIQATLAESSGDVSWAIHAADTPELAVSSTAVASGTFASGRNPTQPIRRANHAIYIKITATTRWAMESIRCVFAGKKKVRGRKP